MIAAIVVKDPAPDIDAGRCSHACAIIDNGRVHHYQLYVFLVARGTVRYFIDNKLLGRKTSCKNQPNKYSYTYNPLHSRQAMS
jgi:hypothetical protein